MGRISYAIPVIPTTRPPNMVISQKNAFPEDFSTISATGIRTKAMTP